jgi:hypothetical protein
MGGYERAATISGRTKYRQSCQNTEGEIPISGQGIYDESATAKYDVGRRLALGDGRVFYYCKNGTTALVRCKLVQTPAHRTDVDDISNAVAGDDYITLATTAAAYTAGDFANGYAILHDVDTGGGYMYKIRDNETIASGGSGKVYLYDPVVAATASQDVTLHRNPCHSVIAAPDQAGFILGAPLIAVSASYYFWCQTWGPCAIHSRAITLTDKLHACSTSASGLSLMPTQMAAVTGGQIVAYTMYDAANYRAAEYELYYLQCMA